MGTITRRIRYTPAPGENTGNLAIFRVTGGDVEWIEGSGYEDGWMVWSGNSNSVYGVGYKAEDSFTDTENHWAKEYIGYAASRGLISGVAADTFAPDAAITRAEFIMALARLSGEDVSGYTASSFVDVDNGTAAMPYIEWAYRNGIVAGTGSNRFSPDAAITREQMAVMLWNYAKAAGLAMPVLREYEPFTDDGMVSSWAGEAVGAVVRAGIIVGRDGGRFAPRSSATRAEATVVLKRFMEYVVD